MKRREENIDDLFRSKLSGFSPDVPDDVWGNIASELETSKRRSFTFWKQGVAVAASIIAGLFVFNAFFNTKTTNQNETLASNKAEWNATEETVPVKKAEILTNNTSETKKPIAQNELNNKRKTVLQDEPEDFKTERNNFRDNMKFAALGEKEEADNLYADLNNLMEHKLTDIETGFDNNSLTLIKSKETYVDYGLNEPEKEGFFSNISIGGQLSPTMSYRNTSQNVGVNETMMARLSGGFSIENKISEKWQIRSGIYLLQYGKYTNEMMIRSVFSDVPRRGLLAVGDPENSETKNVVYENSIGSLVVENAEIVNTKEGVSVNQSNNDEMFMDPALASMKQSLTQQASTSEKNANYDEANYERITLADPIVTQISFLEIPLMFQYQFLERNKFKLKVISGVSTNIILNSGANTGLRLNNISGNMGLGVEIPVMSNLSITLEPSFKYFLNSINAENGGNKEYVKTYLYTSGIYTGLKYTL